VDTVDRVVAVVDAMVDEAAEDDEAEDEVLRAGDTEQQHTTDRWADNPTIRRGNSPAVCAKPHETV